LSFFGLLSSAKIPFEIRKRADKDRIIARALNLITPPLLHIHRTLLDLARILQSKTAAYLGKLHAPADFDAGTGQVGRDPPRNRSPKRDEYNSRLRLPKLFFATSSCQKGLVPRQSLHIAGPLVQQQGPSEISGLFLSSRRVRLKVGGFHVT